MSMDMVPTEEQEQETLFAWAAANEAAHPALRLLFAIPNGGYRHKQTAVRMKRTGVKPGVPDMCLPVACGGHHSLWIELKRRKGGHVSVTQRTWQRMLEDEGNLCMVCYGWEDAARCITDYLRGGFGNDGG